MEREDTSHAIAPTRLPLALALALVPVASVVVAEVGVRNATNVARLVISLVTACRPEETMAVVAAEGMAVIRATAEEAVSAEHAAEVRPATLAEVMGTCRGTAPKVRSATTVSSFLLICSSYVVLIVYPQAARLGI